MPGPNHGALGATFTVVRGMQAMSLIAITGMTSNFISQMVSASTTPSTILIVTLSIVVISTLYCILTYILYIDSLLPFLINTGCDSVFLIASIVVACLIGRPLSYLNCAALTSTGGDAASWVVSVGINLGKVDYYVWAGASSTICYETKAIWGLMIALCVLFAVSAVVSAFLWKQQRKLVGVKMAV